ncbi:MAG TPA: methylmalonyl Co-A mutase-associated GTPase MeaB [Spirillospora sp.]|nr:methylmalonyl Co-A mutase-associated GTPase MeaB [Spirillospora sp.]
MNPDEQQLVTQVRAGSRRALARLLTRVENESADAMLAALYPHTGQAWVIGVTGAPGTGKSTLVNALALYYRAQGKSVGIVAVDPTSPFSGGAILGDRVRMRDLAGDSGIFIRSMATRGSLGGLAPATRDAVRVLDAAGFDVVLVETVGAGQGEVEIARAAETVIVVEAPGLGDDVQAIKAGILEIADVLVVNKADRPGAESTARALKAMLELGHPAAREGFMAQRERLLPDDPPEEHAPLWVASVVQTVALEKQGIDALADAIAQHRLYLESSRLRERLARRQIEMELYQRLQSALMRRLREKISADEFALAVERVSAREWTPQQAIEWILELLVAKD